jgi:hypothetical protein
MGGKFFNGKFQTCLLAAVLWMNSTVVLAFDHQHQMLTQVLSDVVKLSANKKQTRVDYGLLFKQPNKLNQYLAALSSVKKSDYALWTADEQLSFLINAYNGFTLQLINQNYVKFQSGKVESIK